MTEAPSHHVAKKTVLHNYQRLRRELFWAFDDFLMRVCRIEKLLKTCTTKWWFLTNQGHAHVHKYHFSYGLHLHSTTNILTHILMYINLWLCICRNKFVMFHKKTVSAGYYLMHNWQSGTIIVLLLGSRLVLWTSWVTHWQGNAIEYSEHLGRSVLCGTHWYRSVHQ